MVPEPLKTAIALTAVDLMLVAVEAGGDTRALTITLNMRAAIIARAEVLLRRWMNVLRQHVDRRKTT